MEVSIILFNNCLKFNINNLFFIYYNKIAETAISK